ncbi:putative carboxylesterase [Abeliophyllum distichum]|uniref:Carboxylesterase n=1 Tax=Abeliophyllum distichum TaxID=126358 RepID=A0ABD1U495_9LAMI
MRKKKCLPYRVQPLHFIHQSLNFIVVFLFSIMINLSREEGDVRKTKKMDWTETLPGDVKILGRFLSHPYFWESKPIESETTEETEQNVAYKIWLFVYPFSPGRIDNPMINPFVDDAPSFSGLACSMLLVCLAEKDLLMSRGILYVESMKKSGWNGEMELVGVEGKDQFFHFFDPDLS